MKAFDLSKYQRVIGSDGRVSGSWKVLGGVGRDPEHLYITPIDVTVYDETRSWGRVFYSGDFTLTVQDGVVELSGPRDESKMHDIRDAQTEFDATVLMVADVFMDTVTRVVVADENE